MTTTTATTRDRRVQEIADGATVRAALGQGARHELRGGQHVVQLYDRAAGKLIVGVGATVAEAIREVQRRQQGGQRQ